MLFVCRLKMTTDLLVLDFRNICVFCPKKTFDTFSKFLDVFHHLLAFPLFIQKMAYSHCGEFELMHPEAALLVCCERPRRGAR